MNSKLLEIQRKLQSLEEEVKDINRLKKDVQFVKNFNKIIIPKGLMRKIA